MELSSDKLSATATVSSSTAVVYDVQVRCTDLAGNTSQIARTLLAIYDTSAGFVTGGGWIWSPEGAYTANPEAIGKATFGFVSKYQKGAKVPDGNTQFVFNAYGYNAGDAGIHFHSTSYEWLVISGARAQYKGVGVLNGVGGYGFMLTAVDGDVSGGGGADSFRIKIWDAEGQIIYDNQMGKSDDSNDATTLGGGSIVIHNPPSAGGKK